jgi:Proton-conducting membrane transporter/NADH-Ubiquinone oxidoreductase (complex I), chain 5 N-terminus
VLKPSGDPLTAHMPATVTWVSNGVHLYAVVYMRAYPGLYLFLSYLSLFTFFMLVLVTADNLVQMLVGWEGIGVCSYLLIGYWSHRLSAVKSAGKAILVNRISDGVLMWGVVWIWHHTGSLEYDLVLMYASESTPSSLMLVSVLLGAMGKSAQILFHVWLADAMEGPTPVSALIHAATLVTAGVYFFLGVHPTPASPCDDGGPHGYSTLNSLCLVAFLCRYFRASSGMAACGGVHHHRRVRLVGLLQLCRPGLGACPVALLRMAMLAGCTRGWLGALMYRRNTESRC